jgi:hypothetical protein
MSINPDIIYQSLILLYSPVKPFAVITTESLWRIKGPFHGDLVAGLIVSLYQILMEIIYSAPQYQNLGAFHIYVDDIIITLRAYGGDGGFHEIMRNYIKFVGIYSFQIDGYYPDNDMYGWWIINPPEKHQYTLYTFRSAEFVQGFISICEAFGINYENKALSYPFTYDENTDTITQYDILR